MLICSFGSWPLPSVVKRYKTTPPWEDLPSVEQAINISRASGLNMVSPTSGDGILFPECRSKQSGETLSSTYNSKTPAMPEESVQFLISFIPATPSSNPTKFSSNNNHPITPPILNRKTYMIKTYNTPKGTIHGHQPETKHMINLKRGLPLIVGSLTTKA